MSYRRPLFRALRNVGPSDFANSRTKMSGRLSGLGSNRAVGTTFPALWPPSTHLAAAKMSYRRPSRMSDRRTLRNRAPKCRDVYPDWAPIGPTCRRSAEALNKCRTAGPFPTFWAICPTQRHLFELSSICPTYRHFFNLADVLTFCGTPENTAECRTVGPPAHPFPDVVTSDLSDRRTSGTRVPGKMSDRGSAAKCRTVGSRPRHFSMSVRRPYVRRSDKKMSERRKDLRACCLRLSCSLCLPKCIRRTCLHRGN